MQKRKGKRINFRIVHCSSEDPEYPVSELLKQSPEARGWQNKRFSSYPETIVMELAETSLVNKIAVLAHQSKIATKVEFEVKVGEEDHWRKLGRISLDSNANTNFQARELKQANINEVEVRFIRLILRSNHVNNQNIFNQVGLISVSFYGFRAAEGQHQQKGLPVISKPSAEVDANTVNRIQELEVKKRRAVENQDFDMAKEIKAEIDRLKNVAVQISRLEQRKQEAIRRENYDDAKVINEEIKRLRSGNPQPQPALRQNKFPPVVNQPQQDYGASVSPISQSRAPQPIQQKPRQAYRPPTTMSYDEDERPLNNKNTQNAPAEYDQPQDNRTGSELEPLNKELYDECSQFFEVIDEQIFRHLFSKDHVNREKGLSDVMGELRMTQSKQQFIGAGLYVVKNLIDDKIASVLISVVTLMGEMMKKLKPGANSSHLPLVDYILQKMADYLGHINEKIRGVTEMTYGNFPIYHLTNKDVCYRALAMIGKRDKPPKILVGRLKMINRLVKEYQLGRNYEDVIKYAVKYADDKNSDVRNAAINTICSISLQIGFGEVQPFLKNLRQPIINSIQEKIDEAGGAQGGGPQDLDERPIRPLKTGAKQRAPQEMDVGNEFMQIPNKSRVFNETNEDEMCDFCKRVDPRFVEEDYKDLHFFNACPMLSICTECGQAVEVSSLTSHLVGECANSKYYKKCPRCKEAVHQKIYKAHVEKKECLPAKPMAAANRCPLCHLDISPGQDGWKKHLVDEGCQNNPRA